MIDIPGVDIPGPGDIIGGIGGFFSGLAADAGQAIIELVLGVIFGFIADAVAAVVAALAPAFNSTTVAVNLRDGWFVGEGAEVTTMTSVVAGSLVLVFLLMSLVRSLFAGEFSAMWRAALIDVPVAFLATALTVTVAAGLLAAVDEGSIRLVGEDGATLSAFSESLADAERIGAAGLLGILFGLLFIIGAVLIWIQLLVRSALIYIVIAFAPITWVTRAYPGTRHIARRGAEIGVALIVSKFAMAVSFRLGAAAMAASNADSGEANLSAMLVGAAIMLMTAFMPWMVFKAIPFAEGASVAAGAERAAVATAVIGGGLALAGAAKLAGTGAGVVSGARQAGAAGYAGPNPVPPGDGPGGGAGGAGAAAPGTGSAGPGPSGVGGGAARAAGNGAAAGNTPPAGTAPPTTSASSTGPNPAGTGASASASTPGGPSGPSAAPTPAAPPTTGSSGGGGAQPSTSARNGAQR